MKRTQIYIDNDIFKEIETESKITKKSISEIIRNSINDRYKRKTNNILKNIESIKGLWSDKNIDVNNYIRDLRSDRKL